MYCDDFQRSLFWISGIVSGVVPKSLVSLVLGVRWAPDVGCAEINDPKSKERDNRCLTI